MGKDNTARTIDTDVIVRLITCDDPKKQTAAATLFEKVEKDEMVLLAPGTVIADAVFVLASPKWYKLPRGKIRDILTSLLNYKNFKVEINEFSPPLLTHMRQRILILETVCW